MSILPSWRRILALLVLGTTWSWGPVSATLAADLVAEPRPLPGRNRTFLFTYAATITGLEPGSQARIWLPVPQSTNDQDVEIISQELPATEQIGAEPRFGNRILHVAARASAEGAIPLSVVYRVRRREVRADLIKVPDRGEPLDRFLAADSRVPVAGKPLELLRGQDLPSDPLAAARVLYDLVHRHMRYSKEGTGWGQGDAAWACASGHGNCSDFHSLFISLARSRKIPARFEIGFPLPETRGAGPVAGYHCWAWFRPEGRDWIPVDISEASKNPRLLDYYFGNLTENRVAFSTGRDIVLVPRQDGPPLNFFIDPYVEVAGKPYPAARVRLHYAFKDLPAGNP